MQGHQRKQFQIGTGGYKMSKIKLKPCPFCGSPGVIRCIAVSVAPYFAECSNELCIAGDSGVSFSTEEEAAEAWNRRKGE